MHIIFIGLLLFSLAYHVLKISYAKIKFYIKKLNLKLLYLKKINNIRFKKIIKKKKIIWNQQALSLSVIDPVSWRVIESSS